MTTDTHVITSAAQPILRVRGLSKSYQRKNVSWRRPDLILGANEVDFEISAGQTLALVGRSGSGKSTVATCVTRLQKPDAVESWLEGTDMAQLSPPALPPFLPPLQLLFHD